MIEPELAPTRLKELGDFMDELGIWFKDIYLLDRALTHSSYTFENKRDIILNNERLEFLGDAVLKLVASQYLYNRFIDYTEGDMTKIRAILVSDPTWAKIAEEMNIGSYLRLGYHEEQAGGRKRKSILACAFEAFMGALYLDSNFGEVYTLTTHLFEKYVDEVDQSELKSNAKAVLQEYTQANNLGLPEYVITKEEGPAHDKIFTATVLINSMTYGTGIGASKKIAHQEAAIEALKKLNIGDV